MEALQLQSSVGFAGSVPGGLNIAANALVYPLGGTLIVRDITDNQAQHFLRGTHTDTLTAVKASKSGRFIASGQKTHVAHRAPIIVWDAFARSPLYTLEGVHKVSVRAMAFSPSEKYMVSLGGPQDNTVCLWDLKTGKPLAQAAASKDSSGLTLTVSFSSTHDEIFMTGGEYTLRVWEIDPNTRKLQPTECQLGQLKRVVTSIVCDDDDTNMWCGTTSGDVLQVNINTKLFKASGPKALLNKGIYSVTQVGQSLLVGTGTGALALLKKANLATVSKTTNVEGVVTSLAVTPEGIVFCGTDQSNIYEIKNTADLSVVELESTSHFSRINDVTFAWDYSELFVTSSNGDIRVWNSKTSAQLLRISIPNINCTCVVITRNGKNIVSGWQDGKIRAYSPQTGKLLYTINDAHPAGVTGLAVFDDFSKLVSGGADGQVRLWRIGKSQTMEGAFKEHKGPITCMAVHGNLVVTSCTDGSCIVWDASKGLQRLRCILTATQLQGVDIYNANGVVDVVTVGADKKVVWWELNDTAATAYRTVEVGIVPTAVCISREGHLLATAGADGVVWDYESGNCFAEGYGHSSAVTKLALSPNNRFLVSVGEEAAVLIWPIPKQ